MDRSPWRRLSRSGWLFIVLAVVLGCVAWFSFDASRAGSDVLDVEETKESGRLVAARLAFERSGVDLLVDRLLVGIGERAPDSAIGDDARDRLQQAHATMRDIAAGDGPVATAAAEIVASIDPAVVTDGPSDDRTALYDAVDDVRWSSEGTPEAPGFDEMFELGFFATLPNHVLVEALAAYASVEELSVERSATPLYREVTEVLRTDGGWFGESSDAPLTDSDWFDIENARRAYPAVTDEVEQLFASSDLVTVDTWMRELGDSSTPAPLPLPDMMTATAELEDAATDLIAPLLEAETAEAVARAESDADARSTMNLVAAIAAAAALVLMALGLVRVVRHRRSLRRLSDLALNDAVTGVSSRYVLETTVRSALTDARYGHHVVVMVDLDHFKMVNDAFGHAAGDAVLREVGARLREVADATASGSNPNGRSQVVRMGGDEFLIAVHTPTQVQIDRLSADLDAIRLRPFDVSVDGRVESILPEFSFGLADVIGRGDLDALMAAADLAAYADKTKRSTDRRRMGRGTRLGDAPWPDEVSSSS